MNFNITNRIDYHISQLKTLEQNTKAIKIIKQPKEKIGESVGEWLIGELASEIFKSNEAGKLGRRWTREQYKSQDKIRYEQNLRNLEGEFQNIHNQIKAFFSTISIVKKNLDKQGNSNLLLKKLATIENSSKLEAKIRKTMTMLAQLKEENLIINAEIASVLEQKKSASHKEDYENLKILEERLRSIIQFRLSKITTEWWKQRIPQDVQENAKKRKGENDSPWSFFRSGHDLIDFVDFPDYAKIITRRDNWNEVFSSIFYNKEEFATKLKELEPIRNAISHSRNLSSKQKTRLRLYSDDIIERIQKSER
ncbi:Swt1 family HEPN domain-containing protein [Candidatus Nitrosotenuis sp. DW1]|uniref:Swt1 family HEPN domain-containing protein n=1 Tax=Candidatus Nitrosotenuis sp. DW1 TaxID=2259672 RepID=UPI0015CA3B3B|nr:Swt1 family HEPN domain-containing protein [Candidatus Nitrosotenuis sp. DW1]QLH09473.1 hypothetical protein DSQ19_08290 [Candidatus Nitrosotenuis sp. DW1]